MIFNYEILTEKYIWRRKFNKYGEQLYNWKTIEQIKKEIELEKTLLEEVKKQTCNY